MNSILFIFACLLGVTFALPAWNAPRITGDDEYSCKSYHEMAERWNDRKVQRISKILAGIVCDANNATIPKYIELTACLSKLQPEKNDLYIKGCVPVVDSSSTHCGVAAQLLSCQQKEMLKACRRPRESAYLARSTQLIFYMVKQPKETEQCLTEYDAMLEKIASRSRAVVPFL